MKNITRTLTTISATVICYNRTTKGEEPVQVATLAPATEQELLEIAKGEDLVPLHVENMLQETCTYAMPVMKFIENSVCIKIEGGETE